MVGSAILRCFKSNGFMNLITRGHSQLDLLDQAKTLKFFYNEKPDYVIIAAAKVGGILANNTYKAQFLYENSQIQNNIIHSSYKVNVKKLLFLGSACIYPRLSEQPIQESALLSGPLEPTNEYYSIAKIAGIKLCQGYFEQYGSNFFSVMPNNLYGQNDNFDLQTSHVIPALLRKIYQAYKNNTESVEIWGSGRPLREFLHVDDLASACFFLLNNLNAKEIYDLEISHLNIGSGEEVSIKKLATIIKKIVKFKGELVFDLTKPDGMPKKLLDTSRMNKLGWQARIRLEEGIKNLYDWYTSNYV